LKEKHGDRIKMLTACR